VVLLGTGFEIDSTVVTGFLIWGWDELERT